MQLQTSPIAPAKSARSARWKGNLVIACFILLTGLGLHTWFEFAVDRFPHSVILSIVLSAVPYELFALSALTPSSFANRVLLLICVAVLVAIDLLFASTWTEIGKEAAFGIGFVWLIEGVFALLASFLVVLIGLPDEPRHLGGSGVNRPN